MGAPLYAAITDHIDLITDCVDNLSQLIKGRTAAIKLASTVIRYHNGIRSNIDCLSGVLHRHYPFQAERLAPPLTHFRRGVPVHGLVEHRGEVVGHRDAHVGALGNVVLKVRQLKRLPEQVIERPVGMRSETHQAGGGESWWRGKPRPQIALTIAANDGIDSERQRIKTCVEAPIDHAPGERLVLVIVELKDLGGADGLANFLDPHCGQRGDAK